MAAVWAFLLMFDTDRLNMFFVWKKFTEKKASNVVFSIRNNFAGVARDQLLLCLEQKEILSSQQVQLIEYYYINYKYHRFGTSLNFKGFLSILVPSKEPAVFEIRIAFMQIRIQLFFQRTEIKPHWTIFLTNYIAFYTCIPTGSYLCIGPVFLSFWLFIDLLDPDPGGQRIRIQCGSRSETLFDGIAYWNWYRYFA
jgi:hypothetical protein